MNAFPVLWARPKGGRLHAVERDDAAMAAGRGYTEALCGAHLPAEDLGFERVPSGTLCLPCMIGATADLPDPGRFGPPL